MKQSASVGAIEASSSSALRRRSGWRAGETAFMFVHVYDPRRLILFSLFPPGGVPGDTDQSIMALERLVADVARNPLACATMVVTVADESAPPDASQRKRLAECTRRIPRHRFAFITQSAVARTIVTAIGWMTPLTTNVKRSAHASYEDARPWLMKHTEHPIEVFDAIHREVQGHPHAALARAAR
jgi:hypothetical protein